jgi:hypothetical protein
MKTRSRGFYRSVLPVLAFLALGGGSCSYHFQQTGKPEGLQISSIAVPMVKSPSSTLGFEGDFTRIVREEFIDNSGLSVVSKESADAVLEIQITRIGSDPLTYNVTQSSVQGRTFDYATTSSKWLWLKMDARLIDRVSGRILWDQKGVTDKASYSVSTDPLKTRYYRTLAVKTIARNLAKRVYAQTMERF